MSNVPKLRFKEFKGEWQEKTLAQLATFYNSKRVPLTESNRVKGPYPYYGASGIIDYVEDYLFDGTYILLGEDGANIVLRNSRLVFLAHGKFWVNNHAHIFQAKESNQFLCEALERLNYTKYNTGTAQPKLNSNVVKKVRVSTPSRDEQQKIAAFLTAVDTKIEQLTQKEALLKQYKKGVMQKIFSQEIRFKADDGSEFPEWEEQRLSKYFSEYKEKSKVENQHPVLTSSNKGLILQSEYFGDNRLTERNNLGFNVVPEKYITFRSRSDNRSFTFNQNRLGFVGVISTYYPVFTCKGGDNRFFVELLNHFQHFIGRHSVGTSQTVLSFNELCRIKFDIPTEAEQRKIATFITTIDAKLSFLSKQLDTIKTFKKGLLQQMFV